MRAMVLEDLKQPLHLRDIPIPIPGEDQVLIQVRACAVCRTDLHLVDGELSPLTLPLIIGHQIVGIIIETGKRVKSFQVGDRVGVPWLGGSCGHCPYCLMGRENLCDHAIYTGYQMNGGFAEYCVANASFIFPIPPAYPDIQVAPLLCGGLIGYRAFRMAKAAKRIGFYGFGSAAHILTQLAVYERGEVYAFTRQGDEEGQTFARQVGAVWSGDSDQLPPNQLDAVIIFAPVGSLVPFALRAIRKGGIVICAGIHMSDIPSIPYDLLYGERILCSVANLTRRDGEEFLAIAPKIPIQTRVNTYPLEQANQALNDLREGKFVGSAVLKIS